MLSSLPLLEIDLSPTELAQRPRGGDQSGYLENPREERDPLVQHSQRPSLSPIVGQSELRRVASSHDTHLDNYIISSGGGVGGGGSDGDGARGGAVTAAELEPTAVQDYPGTGTR